MHRAKSYVTCLYPWQPARRSVRYEYFIEYIFILYWMCHLWLRTIYLSRVRCCLHKITQISTKDARSSVFRERRASKLIKAVLKFIPQLVQGLITLKVHVFCCRVKGNCLALAFRHNKCIYFDRHSRFKFFSNIFDGVFEIKASRNPYLQK